MFKKSSPFKQPLIVSILNDLRAPKVLNSDESLYSFVNRRFGSEVASYLIDPISRGVFAGNARELSVKCLAKSIHEYEQQYGGVIKGALCSVFNRNEYDEVLLNPLVKRARKEKWAAWSLRGGLENLVTCLEEDVLEKGVEIRRNTPVLGMHSGSDGKIQIKTKDGVDCSDHLISSLPANVLSKLICPLNAHIATLLDKIPYVTVAVVNVEYDSPDIITDQAFGYLVPSTEPSRVLGVIYDTCTFPQTGKTIFTVMLGGYWFESLFGRNPKPVDLEHIALKELESSLSIKRPPSHVKASIHRDCIPQYTVGHSESVTNMRKLIRDLKMPLSVIGNAYDGVGINDTVLSSKRSVQALFS